MTEATTVENIDINVNGVSRSETPEPATTTKKKKKSSGRPIPPQLESAPSEARRLPRAVLPDFGDININRHVELEKTSTVDQTFNVFRLFAK